jgi:hypothetical protein
MVGYPETDKKVNRAWLLHKQKARKPSGFRAHHLEPNYCRADQLLSAQD